MKSNAAVCSVPDCEEPVWFTVEVLCRLHGNEAELHIDRNNLIDLPIVDIPARSRRATPQPQGDQA